MQDILFSSIFRWEIYLLEHQFRSLWDKVDQPPLVIHSEWLMLLAKARHSLMVMEQLSLVQHKQERSGIVILVNFLSLIF